MIQSNDKAGTNSAGQFVAWGKLSRDSAGQLTGMHPLLDHMTDVAACFLAMAEVNSIRHALEVTACRRLDEVDLQRLAVVVFLHDIGKANAGFQSRRWLLPARPPGNWPITPFGHGPEGWQLVVGGIPDAENYVAGLPIAELMSWGDDALCELLQASISHHPVREDPAKQAASIWKPVYDSQGALLYSPAFTIRCMGERLRGIFPLAFTRCLQPLHHRPAFSHLFAGLVQLADWLGSDTREGFFPYTGPGKDRGKTAHDRARYAVRLIGLYSAIRCINCEVFCAHEGRRQRRQGGSWTFT